MKPRLPTKQSGASLLLALFIATVFGLALFFAGNNERNPSTFRDVATEAALAEAKAALIGYAATYRDRKTDSAFGYLPCPDTNNSGFETANCGTAGETAIGRLPYKTLGLPPLHDSSGECLWYIVSGGHKSNPKTDPLNWDTRGQIRIIDASNAQLTGPDDIYGGAVAAVIAPGPPLPGQNRGTGSYPCSGDASNNIAAYLDGNYPESGNGTLDLSIGAPRSSTNNDRINWISAREVFDTLAKRNDLLGNLLTELTGCLNITDTRNLPPANPQPANPAYFSTLGSKIVTTPAGLEEVMKVSRRNCSLAGATASAWNNWKDHFRYVICTDPGSTCLQVNTAQCSGVLLFGGRLASGNPRTAAERSTPASYFDPNNVSALTTSTSTAFNGATLYDGFQPSRDIAICLQPTALSFQNNIADLTLTAPKINNLSMASIDASAKTLTLGASNLTGNDVGLNPATLFGCSWFGTPLAFGSGLRAYFSYRIVNSGEGFVFALADADASINPGTAMCGRGDSSLGYSGLPNNGDPVPGLTVLPIHPPKIGFEIDTSENSSRKDPNNSHLAFLYWGAPSIDDDDNVHGAPDPALPNNPQNPSAVSRGIVNDLKTNLHVRIEIDRTRLSDRSNYVLRAWVLNNLPQEFNNLNEAFDESIAKPNLRTSATIFNLAPEKEAMRYIRLGFTNAAAGSRSSDQVIVISNFAALNLP